MGVDYCLAAAYAIQTASLKRWIDCKNTCTVWVLLNDRRAARRVGLGFLSLNVQNSIRFCIHSVTQRCKNKPLTIEKLNPVSVKRILQKTFKEKFKAIISFKFAKKIRKKFVSSSAPPPPTKKVLRLRIRKKTCGAGLRGDQTPLFVHLWF